MRIFRSNLFRKFARVFTTPAVIVVVFLVLIMAENALPREDAALPGLTLGLIASLTVWSLVSWRRRVLPRLVVPVEHPAGATENLGHEMDQKTESSPKIQGLYSVKEHPSPLDGTNGKRQERVGELRRTLSRTRENYKRLLEITGAAYFEARDSSLSRWSYVSEPIVELLGFPAEDWYQEGFWKSRVHPEDLPRLEIRLEAELGDGQSAQLEYRMIARTGASLRIHHLVSPRFASGVLKGVEGFLLDVTADRRIKEKLEQTNIRLQQAQKMEVIGRLASGVAHDFNNILTIIKGYTDPIILKNLDESSPNYEYIQEINKAVDRGIGLIRQLMLFNRKERQCPETINLNNIISGIQKLLRRIAGEEIELKLAFDPSLGDINCDPGQIEQILLNLVVNAKDAMSQGGTISIVTANAHFDESNYIDGIEPGFYTMLSVSDMGCGIPAQVRAQIFEPFFTTKRQDKGTGLGLATVKDIVSDNQGYIEVESEPGEGTTFWIFLPQKSETIQSLEKQSQNTFQMSPESDRSETVLVIEDDESVRALIKETLCVQGYRVIEAGDGQQGLELYRARRQKIDLVISDIGLPCRNGYEIAKDISSVDPEAKFLFLSGYSDIDLEDRGMLVTEYPFLSKAFTPGQLILEVYNALAGHRQKAGVRQ